jgi:hypothetical protein
MQTHAYYFATLIVIIITLLNVSFLMVIN